MKYWCYYTDVVRYLERLEASQSLKTAAPAYLVWHDDDGPSMIAGPGIDWHRGEGPPPDIDAINLRARRPPVSARRTPPDRNTQSRKTWRTHSCGPNPPSPRPHRRSSLPPKETTEPLAAACGQDPQSPRIHQVQDVPVPSSHHPQSNQNGPVPT